MHQECGVFSPCAHIFPPTSPVSFHVTNILLTLLLIIIINIIIIIIVLIIIIIVIIITIVTFLLLVFHLTNLHPDDNPYPLTYLRACQEGCV